ncbi:MAG: F0F1 ATP synthase subunit B [Chloroflexota bacterium]|nr:F0F1 ATP synthase subunit B [Chloroflexota bacterium]MDE2931204.1 F0F1 ATP synthase subunit B [Chloroflexota bacterium]
MGELGINPFYLAFQIINFLLLVFLLHRLLYRPVLNMLDQRKERIREGQEAAERAQSEAEELRQEYERQLEESRAHARKIIEDATAAAARLREESVANAQQEAQRILERGQEELRAEVQHARRELRQEVATLSVAVAGKLIQESLDSEKNRELAARLVSDLDDSS